MKVTGKIDSGIGCTGSRAVWQFSGFSQIDLAGNIQKPGRLDIDTPDSLPRFLQNSSAYANETKKGNVQFRFHLNIN